MKCKRCGSENTNFYEKVCKEEKIGHGCLWWIFIGWWWWIICSWLNWIGFLIGVITSFPVKTVKKKRKYFYCKDCGYEEEID